MQRLSAWARWIVLGLVGSQFALEIFKQVAERIGLYDRPREAVSTVLKFFLSLAELPWLRITMLAFGCFAAGMWLDWLLRKFDGSRAKAREELGFEMWDLAYRIDQAARQNFSIQQLRHELASTFIKAKKVGLWVPVAKKAGLWEPDDRIYKINGGVLTDYLRHVGTLLNERQFAEAKGAALQHKRTFAQAVAQRQKG